MVWDLDKNNWWTRKMYENIYRNTWETVEQAEYAIESALVFHEFPPMSYKIKKCTFKLIEKEDI